jgi:hypothetical protein
MHGRSEFSEQDIRLVEFRNQNMKLSESGFRKQNMELNGNGKHNGDGQKHNGDGQDTP